MSKTTVLASLLALAISSAYAQQQAPPQQPPQPSQGGRGQGRAGGGNGGQRQNPQNPQGQPRDRQTQTRAGTSSIAGRVLAADTGRPVKRAQVFVTGGGGGRGGRGATTDERGAYAVTGLTAGTYTITASKNGFVDAVYGQRRPLQPGIPIEINDNQQAANVDLRLTRGGVVTGRVLDEDGEALARALVTVQRYQYIRGDRQLTPAGGDQTDDRGVYRVFGLPPGDYYVSVSVNGLGQMLGRGLQQLAAGVLAGAAGGRGGRGGVGALFSNGAVDESEPSGYAPTYYPGVVSAAEAGKVTVGPGQEVTGIDFQIQLVPLATVSGVVAGADESVTVTLAPQDSNARGPLGGATFAGRTQQDGSFSIANVPPGRYVAVARSGGRQNQPRTAVQAVVVNGQNIGGIALALQPGVTLTGNIVVESSGAPAPTDYSGFRIDAPEANPLPIGGGGRGGPFGTGGRAAPNGSFQVSNLLPGRHYIRVTGQPQTQGQVLGQASTQWNLKTVLVSGQDVTDSGVDLKPGENVDNVTIVMSDRSTDVSGTVRDAKGAPAPALTVIAFSSDPQYWRAQSRFIQASRTDQNGVFHFRALPPGDYFVLVTDEVEQGEWFDPSYLEQAKQGAQHMSLTEGEKKTLDLSAPGRT